MASVARLPMVLGLVLTVCACGGRGGDRQEDITSLRTFGVAANPLVAMPSVSGQPAKTVEVTLYAAIPLGATATLAPFLDSGSSEGAVKLEAAAIQVEPGPGTYVDYSAYRLYTAKALLAVPTVAAFHGAPGAFAGGQLRYGLTVTAAGQHEDVIATLIVFPAGAPELAWLNPTVDIAAPLGSAPVSVTSDIDLKATITDGAPESQKVGWFVTNGEVGNRGAAATTWKLKTAGAQTVAVAVHGLTSRGFALKVLQVTGQ